jgi:phosphoribosylformylglycinamidine synthase II
MKKQVAQSPGSEIAPWRRQATLADALAHGLTEQEFAQITTLLERSLSILEVGICSALYSEHCSYKSTRVHLKGLPTTGPRVLQGPGENAGVLDIGDGLAVVFKIESHNHPSFIEPFQGAATGVGGILRDVFTMGARPLALMNALRFGDPADPKTHYLLQHAVEGIGFYGNCMGVPTVGGELSFHPAFAGNCLVNAFALGIARHEGIFLGRAAGVGNKIYYVGSKTGRDGIHGATMASESFADDSQQKRPTVQVGDPFQEKLLLEACLELMRTDAVAGIQDMGAAGLTSSTYEMAERAGTGVRMYLDRVPQRESEMTPYEIMLSESQERMLVVVHKGKEQIVKDIFTHWHLDAAEIGEVVEGNQVELYWQGEVVSALPVAAVTSAVPQYRWPEAAPADYEARLAFDASEVEEPQSAALVESWYALIGSPNLCSRFPLYRQYDSTVRGNSVVLPGGDAAVIRIKPSEFAVHGSKPKTAAQGGPEKGIAMTLDCNSVYCSLDPRQGAALAVAEAVRNISAVGAYPIGLSDNLNFGSPERPEGMWQIAEGLRGLSEAARAFEVPIISGNVSLYNESKGKAILPTPVVAMVGLIEDAKLCIGSSFQAAGDRILVLGKTREDELGGSEYLSQRFKIERGSLPQLDYALELATNALVRSLIGAGLLRSCHDVSSGGLAVALVECCVGPYQSIGASIQLEPDQQGASTRTDGLLFAESGARYLLSCSPENEAQVRSLCAQAGLCISLAGTVGGDVIAVKDIAALDLERAQKVWREGLAELFG